MSFIIKLILNSIIILAVAHFVPGILVQSFSAAIFFAIILGVVNVLVRPLLVLLTLPLSILTLGLFTLIVNAFTFWLASLLSFGVSIETFAAAFWGGLLVWIATMIINRFVSPPIKD